MDYPFLKPNSIANFQTIPYESVTGIAVKEDRRQNIYEQRNLWRRESKNFLASERVARFINALGVHREHVEK